MQVVVASKHASMTGICDTVYACVETMRRSIRAKKVVHYCHDILMVRLYYCLINNLNKI